ncbi:DUF6461 domain-containing protein [Streptomyces sp. Da 82-17]|uniref:DUF6461 domain-containing protein n=1 Tax=Streptomyces sp. Da 82-17 TaxID=3377116 RepID=UPI0038D4EC62
MCHSLTLVEGLTDRELLARLGCDPASTRRPADSDEVQDARQEAWEHYDEHGLETAVVQAGVANGWAWAFEPESVLVFGSERLAPASRGTRLIHCCHNGNALGYVALWEDGRLITTFEHGVPEARHDEDGEDPDRLLEPMRRVGFLDPDNHQLPQHTSLALLHAPTGVTLDSDQIDAGLLATLSAARG